MAVSDPVRRGLVQSMPRPGGNITGVANSRAELTAKLADDPLVAENAARVGADRIVTIAGRLEGHWPRHVTEGWLSIWDLAKPVIAQVHGYALAGGLELAMACHIRVADETTFYALPEGARGIFVGGGGAVRIPRLIGAARMADMMLTGRVYNAQDGERIGFAQYLVPAGKATEKALELAERVAQNAPLTNFALMHALPRIAEQPADQGFLTEALMAAIAQSAPEAKQRVRDFLEGRAAKVRKC